MIIKKFEKFTQNLAQDILILNQELDQYEKIEEPVELVQITGMLTDPEEIKKIEEGLKKKESCGINIEESISVKESSFAKNSIHEGMTIDSSLTVQDVKRGQIIWLTAVLKRKGMTQSYNQQALGVLKCRIVDYYYGLNILKNLMK